MVEGKGVSFLQRRLSEGLGVYFEARSGWEPSRRSFPWERHSFRGKLWKMNTTCLEFGDEEVGLAERFLLGGGLRVYGCEGGADPLLVDEGGGRVEEVADHDGGAGDSQGHYTVPDGGWVRVSTD